MALTKDVVVKRIEDLKTNIEQLKAQINMVQGALADSEWVLSQLEEPVVSPVEEKEKE